MALSMVRTGSRPIASGVVANRNNRSEARAVVLSLVRRLKTQEMRIRKGSLDSSAITPTIGTCHCRISPFRIATTLLIGTGRLMEKTTIFEDLWSIMAAS